jgi:rhodanese-related sulfurtransferase
MEIFMKTITTEALKARLDQERDLTLVNTLDTESFEATKIPGAVNVPLSDSDFASHVEQIAGGKDRPIVVYCANQQCNASKKAAEKLEAAGFTDVSRYTGGAAAWEQEAGAMAAGK